ncbi:MAG: DUF6371 domain-containing protein [Ginsengibacter sp.]
MENYRYILKPYKGMKSRYTCPACNGRKTFARYLDTKTGEHLPEQYGKCNRADKCGYHLNPYHDGYSQTIWEQEKGNHSEFPKDWKPTQPQPKPQPPAKPVSFILLDSLKQSLKAYEQNNFVKFLIDLFGIEITTKLVSKYFIGTSKHWPGATIFWQIDITGTIRSGKIMLYSPTTGKRVKEPFNHIAWVHTAINEPEFNLQQCFYGEHLLKGNTKPVAIVESEKTAIIASLYFPKFVWIAAGNLHSLNAEKCEALRGRQVVLYPDLSKPQPGKPTAFEKWSEKARELSNITRFFVNDLLERKAGETQKIVGGDFADYLVKFDYRKFIEPDPVRMPALKMEDILLIPTETHTGKEFDNLIIAWIKTKQGKNYELLFNKYENWLPYGENKEAVTKLERFFNKVFKPLQFENEIYHSHIF